MTQEEKQFGAREVNRQLGEKIQTLTRDANTYEYLYPRKSRECVKQIRELENQRIAAIKKLDDIPVD